MGRRAAKRREERRALVETVLRNRRRCEYPGCGRAPDDVHERVSRARGGSELDPENVVALCRYHHRYIHDHPKEAEELDLLRPSWMRPPR